MTTITTVGSTVSTQSDQKVADSGQQRTANQGRARRTRAAEAEQTGTSAQTGAAEPPRAATPEAADIDEAWQLPGWVMSLTDLSDASKRAYENGARSFIIWARRGGVRAPRR